MSMSTLTFGAGLPVGLRPPVRLVVADPVPGAGLARRRLHLHVLLERRLVGDRHVEGDDHGHADTDGLALQRRERRVGLLVEREVLGVEPGGAGDLLSLGVLGDGAHAVVEARLEAARGGPAGLVGVQGAGQLALGRGHLDGAQRAVLRAHGDRRVDGYGVGGTDVGLHLDRGYVGRGGLARLGRRPAAGHAVGVAGAQSSGGQPERQRTDKGAVGTRPAHRRAEATDGHAELPVETCWRTSPA